MQDKRQEPGVGTTDALALTAGPGSANERRSGFSGWLLPGTWVVGALAFGWLYQQSANRLQQLEQQLVATQDSFARVSESADGRLLSLSNQLDSVIKLEGGLQALTQDLRELQRARQAGVDGLQHTDQRLTRMQHAAESQASALTAHEGRLELLEADWADFVQQFEQRLAAVTQAQDQQLQDWQEQAGRSQQQWAEQLTHLQSLQDSQDAVQDSVRAELVALQTLTSAQGRQLQEILDALEALAARKPANAEVDSLRQEMTAFRAQVTRMQQGLQQRLATLEQQ